MRQASAIIGGLAYLCATVAWVFVLALAAYLIFASLPAAPVINHVPDALAPVGGGSDDTATPSVVAQVFAVALGMVLLFGAVAFTVVLPVLFTRWCSRRVRALTVSLFGKQYRLQHLVVVKVGIVLAPVVILVVIWLLAPSTVMTALAAAGVAVASFTLLLGSLQLVTARIAGLSVKEIF